MKTVGMFILGLLVVGALAFWVRMEVGFPSAPVLSVAALVGTSTSAATLTASAANAVNTTKGTAATDGDYEDLTGTILLDTTGGTSVPFIQYIGTNNKIATKQLVYADSRACAVNAGDLPCVDVNPNDAYPQYPTGTRVRVRGLHTADRILVYEIDPL
ncbi:MAG: hypothetical protein JWM39_532 [Parcubacteria group bacterium]|nr:hypothetical protein [Parcubacteria group bacterium]